MSLTTRRLAPVALAAMLTLSAAACAPPGGNGGGGGGGITSDVAASINQDRAAQGLPPLAWDPQLAAYAQSWAGHIAAAGALIHTDLQGLMNLPYMASWWTMRENLLYAPAGTGGADAENLWMASPPHQANILDPQVNYVGVGAVYDGSGRVWMVAEFGAR
jgi:uncharacterized protein YkwD